MSQSSNTLLWSLTVCIKDLGKNGCSLAVRASRHMVRRMRGNAEYSDSYFLQLTHSLMMIYCKEASLTRVLSRFGILTRKHAAYLTQSSQNKKGFHTQAFKNGIKYGKFDIHIKTVFGYWHHGRFQIN